MEKGASKENFRNTEQESGIIRDVGQRVVHTLARQTGGGREGRNGGRGVGGYKRGERMEGKEQRTVWILSDFSVQHAACCCSLASSKGDLRGGGVV